MSCYRKACDNIMCDTYIPSIGYICNECQSEFKLYLNENGINLRSQYELTDELNKFMDTEKGRYTDDEPNIIDIDSYFREHSR